MFLCIKMYNLIYASTLAIQNWNSHMQQVSKNFCYVGCACTRKYENKTWRLNRTNRQIMQRSTHNITLAKLKKNDQRTGASTSTNWPGGEGGLGGGRLLSKSGEEHHMFYLKSFRLTGLCPIFRQRIKYW